MKTDDTAFQNVLLDPTQCVSRQNMARQQKI